MKKVLIIGIVCVFLGLLGGLLWYNLSLKPVGNEDVDIQFIVDKGTSSKQVINNLYDAGLIKSKLASLIYLKLNKINIKASTYNLEKKMSTKEILEQLNKGNVSNNTLSITFVEGKRFIEYLQDIAKVYNWDVTELESKTKDKDYLQSLISKYWFIDDSILNPDLYYPLEGYIYPDTYQFYKDATFEDILNKMLDEMGKKLNPYLDQINSKNLTVHELLTMASITEKEAVSIEDRKKVSQVIYKRLNLTMNLGMDVTAYYGVKKDLKENLTSDDLANNNPYNTRLNSFIGLPVGPICSPSLDSIIASLNPADTDYTYFYADIKTGIVYFTDNYNEFLEFKKNFS